MMKTKTSKFISVLISSLLICTSAAAQQPTNPSRQQQPVPAGQTTGTRGVQYVPEQDTASVHLRPIHFFEGLSVSADVVGVVMYQFASWGQIEGALRVNLKERYFPIVELGLGHSDHTDDNSDLHFKTNSPYVRIGCDYNFAKDLYSGNRVFGGVRYGYSKIKFDLDGPDLIDPVWGHVVPYNFKDQDASAQWAELVFGIEAKIWRNFHLGWSLRYKVRLSQSKPDGGQAWYIPGFGKNDGHTFGGTFNLIFDI